MPNSIFPRLQWHEEQVSQITPIPLTVQSWLFEKGSLTARLKQVCQQFDVKVQSEKPIGEWLFSLSAQRIGIQWAKDPESGLYARRSLFLVQEMPLLISELFLENSLIRE